jgi:hypothetical protein
MPSRAAVILVAVLAMAIRSPSADKKSGQPTPPEAGGILVPTGADQKVLIIIEGDDHEPGSLLIAIDSLVANGFLPVVENESIRRMIRNTKTSPFMQGIKDECITGYNRWLEEKAIPPDKEYFANYTVDGKWHRDWKPPTAKVIRIAGRKELASAPALKVNSRRVSSSYRSSVSMGGLPSLGGSLTLWASQRTVELSREGKTIWVQELPAPQFPNSWGTDNPLRVKPDDEGNQNYKNFLSRLIPALPPR